MKRVQVVMDTTAIVVSIVCAIHCALLPLALVALPVLVATPLGDELFHQAMLIGVLPLSLVALAMGCRRHKNRNVVLWGWAGLAVLTFTALFGHDVLGESGEKIATIIGAAIIACGHIQNHRLCCPHHCHLQEPARADIADALMNPPH